jgi:hypothetical protein
MEEEWNPLPPSISEEEEKTDDTHVDTPEEIFGEPDKPEVPEPKEEEPEPIPEPIPEPEEESKEESKEESEVFFQKNRNARRTGLDVRQQEIFDKFDTIGRKNQIQADASLSELEALEKLGRLRRTD